MIKTSKQKLLLTTSFLLILLFSSTFVSMIPSAKAATVSMTEDKLTSITRTLAVLTNVIGMNISGHSIQLNSYSQSNYNGLHQTKVDFNLVSNQSSVRISSSFVNNTLNLLYLSNYNGTFGMTQPARSTTIAAKDFLAKYQTYARDSTYGTFASTLDNTADNTNITKTSENATLKELIFGQATVDYAWTYTDANGIKAQSKDVVLSYYQGHLNCFLNNWPLYKIVDTPTVSREQAIQIAMSATQNYSYKINNGNINSTVSVAGFQVVSASLTHTTLSYVNCPNSSLARDCDPFALYPSWYVPIGFGKLYPADVSGVSVSVWADNGQVGSIGPMSAYSSVASTTQSTLAGGFNLTVLSAPIAIGAILFIGTLFVNRQRIKLAGGRKLFNPMFWSILFCAIIIGSAAISTVRADSVFPQSSARIYGALNGGNGSPAQLPSEQNAANWVGGQIYTDFQASGYTPTDSVGPPTTKQNEVNDASYDETYYDTATVFHFGHLVNYGVGYVDNTGNPIMYSDISPQTTAGRHDFVFLWVCAQANGGPDYSNDNNIAQAWLRYPGLSSDGYNSPDNSGKAFIAFINFSPMISDYHQNFEEQWTQPSEYFIQDFYSQALVSGYSVRDALNLASLSFFPSTYSSSIFSNGYDAWYVDVNNPSNTGYKQGQMAVFGDGAIWLFHPQLTLQTNINYPVTFTINGEQAGLGNVHLWATQTYTIAANSAAGYTFDHWTYNGQYLSNSPTITMQISTNGQLEAYYTGSPLPVYHMITLEAYDCYFGEELPAGIYVDGQQVGSGFAQVQVLEGYHTIDFDSTVWNEQWNTYANLYNINDFTIGRGYGTSAYIYIQSDDLIGGSYAP